jgi:hypothetical protein
LSFDLLLHLVALVSLLPLSFIALCTWQFGF